MKGYLDVKILFIEETDFTDVDIMSLEECYG